MLIKIIFAFTGGAALAALGSLVFEDRVTGAAIGACLGVALGYAYGIIRGDTRDIFIAMPPFAGGLRFDPPVRIHHEGLQTVESVIECLTLLKGMPSTVRDAYFHLALETNSRALAGRASADEARSAFRAFARRAGILAEDDTDT